MRDSALRRPRVFLRKDALFGEHHTESILEMQIDVT